MTDQTDQVNVDRARTLFADLAAQVGEERTQEVLSLAWHLGWMSGYADARRENPSTTSTTPDPFRNPKES
jgi:hypothetical protein